ncbi:MAG: mono/diheme cytochrome c family protein, partial [Myxococcota bacterium]
NNSAGNTQRVAPGDPDSSYLIQKVRGESSAGSPMPLGTSGLGGADLKTLEDWVSGLPPCDEPGTTTGGQTTGGTDTTTDTGTDTTDTGGETTGGTGDPVLPQNIADIFTSACAGCHTNGGESGGLALDPDVAIANVIDVESVGGSGMSLITPGDPDNSWLYLKITAADGASPMPQGTEGLATTDAAAADAIREWILSLADGGGDTGDTGDTGGDDWGALPNNVVDAFVTHCATCHTKGGELGGLALDNAVAIDNLVNVDSIAIPGMVRVAPGDLENSYLWRAITAQDDAKLVMPIGQANGLTDIDPSGLAAIEDWILSLGGPE